MVNYKCEICNKEFKKKSHWIDHTENKKKPCKQTIINNNIKAENYPKLSKNYPKLSKSILETNCVNEKSIKDSYKLDNLKKCNYCLKIFSNIYNLKKHQNGRCKVKNLDEEKKEQIFNKLIDKENKIELMFNNFEELQKNNIKLQDQVKELEKKLKEQTKSYDNKIKDIITKNVNNYSNNTNNTINTNITNNIIIPTDKLVSFGKEDLKKISYNTILKSLGNWDITGYRIFTELLKLIHFNEQFPEYQNVYITDKNREKYMVWNGSDWVLNDICLKQIIDKIQKLVIINEDDFEEAKKNKNFKDILTKLMKYINKYYDETENGFVNNYFIELVNKQLKEYLYNNRIIPKNNFLKLKNDLTKNLIKNT